MFPGDQAARLKQTEEMIMMMMIASFHSPSVQSLLSEKEGGKSNHCWVNCGIYIENICPYEVTDDLHGLTTGNILA